MTLVPRFSILNFNFGPYDSIVERWRRFEALGFDGAWMADDLLVPDYAEYESWGLLAALARDVPRIRLGTLVTTIRLRHPAFLAAEVLTLDRVSGGRAAVGIGTGELEQNARLGAAPWSAEETMARFDEQAAILAVLLRGDPLDHAGPAYPTTVAAMPSPVARPPLVIAAHGPAGLRTAARHATTWNSFGGQAYGGGPRPTGHSGGRGLRDAVAEARRLFERVDDACREVARDPATLGRSVLAYRPEIDPFASVAAFDDFVGAYADLEIEEFTFYWPMLEQVFGEPPTAADEARFDRIATERVLARGARPPESG